MKQKMLSVKTAHIFTLEYMDVWTHLEELSKINVKDFKKHIYLAL